MRTTKPAIDAEQSGRHSRRRAGFIAVLAAGLIVGGVLLAVGRGGFTTTGATVSSPMPSAATTTAPPEPQGGAPSQQETAPDTTPPGSVTGLSAVPVAGGGIQLAWSNPGDADLAEVIVRRSAGDAAPGGPEQGDGVELATATATGVTDGGLADGRYTYAVFPRDGLGNAGAAAVVSAVADGTPPGVVSGLSAVPVAGGGIRLAWSNPGDADLAEVIVRRSAGDAAPTGPLEGDGVELSSATGALDGGLPDGRYSYAVFARDGVGNTGAAAVVTAAADGTAPGSVTGLSAVPVAGGGIRLAWSNPGDADLAEVIVRRSAGDAAPTGPLEGDGVELSSATDVTDGGLADGRYTYAVFARDGVGNTGAAAVVSAVADGTAPGSVTGLSAVPVAGGGIRLAWSNPGDADVAEVMVRRTAGDAAPTGPLEGDRVELSSATAQSVTDGGLADGRYSYAVFAVDPVGNAGAAAVVSAVADGTPPAVVTGLSAVPVAGGGIRLAWSNPGDADLAEVIVRRSAGDAAPGGPEQGEAVNPATATGVFDGGLADGRYTYAVFARDGVGNTGAAAVVTAAADGTAPGSVTGLSAVPVAGGGIRLAWSNPGDADLAEVIVRRNAGNAAPWGPQQGEAVDLATATASGALDEGLADGRYSYAVFTRDALGNRGPSSVVLAVADGTAPGAVTNAKAVATAKTSIDLAWTNPTDADLAEVVVRRAAGEVAPTGSGEGEAVDLNVAIASTVSDSGLAAGTTFSYSVFTRDAAGNAGPVVTMTTSTASEQAVSVTHGGRHTCALLPDGTVQCWGSNAYGQLGDGTNVQRWTPVAVKGISGATGIAAGANHTCALLPDGAVQCWGSNAYGQLGDGTNVQRWTPVAVKGISGATGITAGFFHACALLPDGSACWGSNGFGQLGDGADWGRRPSLR